MFFCRSFARCARVYSLFAGALIFASSSSFAQRNNIGHTRHLHHHNHPHPHVAASAADERFHTSRTGADLNLPLEEDAFVFGVFGDRTGGPDEGVSVLADAVHDINLFEPDLVMTVGDLIQGYNTTQGWMPEMREYKAIMGELLCPWFPVAGNHDIYWRGPDKPEGEHEANYELHFGPLWYAFQHKNSWFIALYSDEGNPETGEKTFGKAESQRMSPEQFEWLRGILKKAADADHIFLFLHHPRWIGGRYGDDWERVHEMLMEAGNVSAVFAGHIHRMRTDPRDGIEYFTLATVGGHQGGSVPKAGWLHHYNLVTVRKDQFAIATVPVGEVLDPRMITGDVSSETSRLAQISFDATSRIEFASDLSVWQPVQFPFTNPTSGTVELTITPDSKDSRWVLAPDHVHKTVVPGETVTTEFLIVRDPGAIDNTFHAPALSVGMTYQRDGFGYPIPERSVPMGLDFSTMQLVESPDNLVLELDGYRDALRIKSADVPLPDGPMTLEAWFEADQYGRRTALLAKTQNSEYGFFISNGQPSFLIHLNDRYVSAEGEDHSLRTMQLYHIAGVYDGSEVRLYLNGQLIDAKQASGSRTTSELDLIVGGDVGRGNSVSSTMDGRIHGFRLSSTARYSGDSFTPEYDLLADEHTVFVSDMDLHLRGWVINQANPQTAGTLESDAHLVKGKK
jgi:hypothetical protein